MKNTTKKILVALLVIFIGFPMVLFLTASAAFWAMDKTNETIVSSGVTRMLTEPPSSRIVGKPEVMPANLLQRY